MSNNKINGAGLLFLLTLFNELWGIEKRSITSLGQAHGNIAYFIPDNVTLIT